MQHISKQKQCDEVCVSVCVHSSQKEDGGYAILLLSEKINQMSRHCQLKQTVDVWLDCEKGNWFMFSVYILNHFWQLQSVV